MLVVSFIAILIGAVGFYAVFIEPNWIRTRRVQIRNPRLHLTIGHLRAVHISDLHISKIGYREKRAIKSTNRLNPDIIFVTGDLIVFKQDFESAVDFLTQIKSEHGIWIVLGNADYSVENGATVFCRELNSRRSKNGSPIHVLRNSHETMQLPKSTNQPIDFVDQSLDSHSLTIIGLDDPVSHEDDLADAMRGVPGNGAKILLTHYQNFKFNSQTSEQFKSVDLVLSGHTHGGQIFILRYLPLSIVRWYFKRKSDEQTKAPIKANNKRVPSVFKGLYRKGDIAGYVNRGLGTSYLALRLGVRPEITLLEFVANS